MRSGRGKTCSPKSTDGKGGGGSLLKCENGRQKNIRDEMKGNTFILEMLRLGKPYVHIFQTLVL